MGLIEMKSTMISSSRNLLIEEIRDGLQLKSFGPQLNQLNSDFIALFMQIGSSSESG
jgi:hypothetical protein